MLYCILSLNIGNIVAFNLFITSLKEMCCNNVAVYTVKRSQQRGNSFCGYSRPVYPSDENMKQHFYNVPA
jgi:hypothetical protein